MKRHFFIFAAGLFFLSCKDVTPEIFSGGVLKTDGKPGTERPAQSPARRLNADFTGVARQALPAVVYIYSLKEDPGPTFISLFHFKEHFWRAIASWIHSRIVASYSEVGAGTGFLISKRGYILTNYHVVANANRIIVRVKHGIETQEEADFLGADPLSDVALIKIKADFRLHALPMGDSDHLEVGEWVAAIGNPYDVGKTFTVGVVSGLRREDIGILELEDFIQTDTAINPGNSGGPLIDGNGRVVGINSVIFSEASGVGLAVPINIAKEILPKLVNGQRIDRGKLGVSLEDLTPENAARPGIPADSGVRVIAVQKGSPAQGAGIRPGDVINTFNGRRVRHYHELKKAIVSLPAGIRVKIGILRDGVTMTVEVTLARLERKS